MKHFLSWSLCSSALPHFVSEGDNKETNTLSTRWCLRPWILSSVVREQLPNRSVSQRLHWENSVWATVMSHTQALRGALVVCMIKEFDPGSKVRCLKSPGRGEVSTFPFLSQDAILFLLFLYFRSNSQCMFLAATTVPSPSLWGKR